MTGAARSRVSHLPRLLPILALAGYGLLAALAGAAACRGWIDGAARVVTVDGSSTVYPIAEAVAEEHRRVDPAARVTVGVSGTGGGFEKFCAGETDMASASRSIRPLEMEACAAAGIEFIELPIAYDGIAVVVHAENDWVDTLTPDDLRRMWEPAAQGTVTRWNQVRPEWPDRELRLFGPGVDSGTFDYFTQAIVGEPGAGRGDFTSSEDDNVLVQGVSNDELALGFFGYAHYEENRGRLGLSAIDDEDDGNGAGGIRPSPDTVRDGSYQPLSRPVFLYVDAEALDRPEVAGFVRYFLTEGAELVREVGYVSLTDREYALVRRRLGDRVVGTMYCHPGRDAGEVASLEALLTRPGYC